MMPSKKSNHKQKLKFEAIGTLWEIDFVGCDLKNKIFSRIESFSKNYSRFRNDSLVTRISQKTGVYKLPDDAKTMFDLYQKLYNETGGLFTPLIGKTLEDAGYDKNYSLKPKKLRTPPLWEDALEYDFPTLKVKRQVLLDFGAGGKGYLVDLLGELLTKNGIDSFSIDAGGDILLRNFPSAIGLENPNNPNEVIGTIEIQNGSLAGSSRNRRKWGSFHHLINPKTLTPANDILATWAIGNSTLVADAISTCLFFVQPEKLSEKFEYVIVRSDLKVRSSHGIC